MGLLMVKQWKAGCGPRPDLACGALSGCSGLDPDVLRVRSCHHWASLDPAIVPTDFRWGWRPPAAATVANMNFVPIKLNDLEIVSRYD
jgi:hypothetical protein